VLVFWVETPRVPSLYSRLENLKSQFHINRSVPVALFGY
jgi:hypothetical protein